MVFHRLRRLFPDFAKRFRPDLKPSHVFSKDLLFQRVQRVAKFSCPNHRRGSRQIMHLCGQLALVFAGLRTMAWQHVDQFGTIDQELGQ